jgi:hypothetical protein
MEILNIEQLIEKNSITRLSKNYENKLINKIKDTFSESNQKLFLASFYCFLNYDSDRDFIIEFDKVWKWLGFTRKDNAKRVLEKHFVLDIDYKIVLLQVEEHKNGDFIFLNLEENKYKKETRGRKEETIMLTVNTFKKFCLKAGTKKADEVHDYYIKLEQLLQETVNEESDELRLQLMYKENEIEKLNTMLHKRYEPKVITEEKFIVYLLLAHINGRTIYIIGKTADINKRYRSYRLKGLLIQEKDIKLIYYKSCRSAAILKQVESCIILNMSKYIIEGCREVFETTELDEKEMIDKFKEVIDFYVDSFKHVSPHITIRDSENKEEARIRTELYVEENRDEINEKVRKDRVENPEKYKEREKKRDPEKKKEKNKRYYENHKEEIANYHKEYRKDPENIKKISDRRKSYNQNMTQEQREEKAKKAKEYREQNKLKRKLYSTQKVKCLVCGSIFSRQCWKRHTKSVFHINALKLNSTINEEFEMIVEDKLENNIEIEEDNVDIEEEE